MNSFPQDEDGNLVDHVPGLEYHRDFLSSREQDELLALVYSNPWQEGVIARRQQFYGEVYYHTSFKSKVLQGCTSNRNKNDDDDENKSEKNSGGDENRDNNNSDNAAMDIVSDRSGNGIPIDDSGMRKWLDKTMPFFEREGLMEPPTQILINEYKNNMGIASHFEDFDAFGPIILTISLVSPVYMTLKKPTIEPKIHRENDNSNIINNENENENNLNSCDSYDDIIKVLLEPGSLLVMKGDARYKYRHGIGKYKWVNLPKSTDTPSERMAATRIKRDDSYRRVSLTVRHLLSTRRKVQESEDESDTIKDPSVY